MSLRKKGRLVSGWLILDKPYKMGSMNAVSRIRSLFQAQKAGHAGTLDPLATGMLPVALGEATKTIPYVIDGQKSYIFTVCWGNQTNTDDAEGEVIKSSKRRPNLEEIKAILGNFTGVISQVPPNFSAIKIGGCRAYTQARSGLYMKIPARKVIILSLNLVRMIDDDHSSFEIKCSKGTYVRSLARDLALNLGCYGHISALRRLDVYPFSEKQMVKIDKLERFQNILEEMDSHLLSPSVALADSTHISISRDQARRIVVGNSIFLCDDSISDSDEKERVCLAYKGRLLAVGHCHQGVFYPKRVLSQSSALAS
ncbi:tRNA pseudouridine(55) synthase TruB [Candidatus Endowatersipora endosymbiont of Watersipora subatra]|uniref:tRNA pseudouridine(55) synthase TruB n=1 Tax=Candidatus Endowatersipora endosymbiont of Watersipora subatra TaxID=3077946 RepID=UPI00312C9676